MLLDANAVLGLAERWRSRSGELQQLAAHGQAATLTVAASELEALVASAGDDLLTLVEAARVSGYSADHLSHEVKQSRIPNAGRKYAPRIRRSDLPIKPSHLRDSPAAPSLTLTRQQIARDAING